MYHKLVFPMNVGSKEGIWLSAKLQVVTPLYPPFNSWAVCCHGRFPTGV